MCGWEWECAPIVTPSDFSFLISSQFKLLEKLFIEPVFTNKVTGILFCLYAGQAISKKVLSASSTLIPIVFSGKSPSLIIVSIINSIDFKEYFSLENSFIWASSCSNVTLVVCYFEIPTLCYINTTAEFLMLLA